MYLWSNYCLKGREAAGDKAFWILVWSSATDLYVAFVKTLLY